MNFSEENYVRLYIRRTLTSLKLGWDGRAVLHEVMKVMDLSGVLEVGEEPAEALALLTEIPLEVVKSGLQKLLSTKTWELRGTTIVWGTFEEAQTCSRSDRIRKAASRARQVTDGHTTSRVVTDSPDPSENVTLPFSHSSTHPPSHSGARGAAAAKVPCPRDLSLTEDQAATLESAGVKLYAIVESTTRFVSKAVGDPSDLRTLVTWRKCLSTAVSGDWNDQNRRPHDPSKGPDRRGGGRDLAVQRDKGFDATANVTGGLRHEV